MDLPPASTSHHSARAAGDTHPISQLVHDYECEVKNYEREIAKHKVAIQLLETRKKGALRTMNNLRSSFAPIHKLPPEVLDEVFKHSLDDVESRYPSRRHMPLVLSTVCQRWRDVALRAAVIWSRISIPESDWDSEDIAEILECYMERSKQHLLTLHLQLPIQAELPVDDGPEHDYFRPALKVIVPHCYRWESLTISGCAHWLLDHPFLYIIKGQLRSLRHLAVLQTFSTVDSNETVTYDIFSGCPNLSFVEAECPPDTPNSVLIPDSLVLPWSQIRSWKVSIEQARALLARPCNSLERLEVSDVTDWESEPVPPDNTSLVSNVVFFALHGPGKEGKDHYSHLLNSVTFPQLSSLELSGVEPFWFTPLLDCLVRSACNITCLNLGYHNLIEDEVVSLLRQTPMVHTLSIKLQAPSQTALSSLILKHERFPKPNPLLPSLQKLNLGLTGCSKPSLSEQEVADVLFSRWLPDPDYAKQIGAVCLQSVTITVSSYQRRDSSFFPQDLESLQYLRIAGMRVDIFVSPF